MWGRGTKLPPFQNPLTESYGEAMSHPLTAHLQVCCESRPGSPTRGPLWLDVGAADMEVKSSQFCFSRWLPFSLLADGIENRGEAAL